LLDELRGIVPRRKYRSDEAVDIVKRAAMLEATTPTTTGTMTLGGVEALGAEVGISPEHVRQAARGTERTARPAPVPAPEENKWAGGPTRIFIERIVEGELPETSFLYLVEEIRHVVGNAGQVSQLGRSFSWSIGKSPSNRNMEVSVGVRGGRTRITILENLAPLLGVVYGPIGGGMGGGGMGVIVSIFGAAMQSTVAVALAVPLWLAATYATGRTVYGHSSRRRRRELTELADRLAAVAEDEINSAPQLPGPR
jgi:hypothetical protein